MDRTFLFLSVALCVSVSLIGAPVTMADWGERAHFDTERVETSELRDGTPVLSYEALPKPARDAVRATIESPDGSHTVYGTEDWPDRFYYSDSIGPGNGLYAIVYEGQLYELTTYASGAFPYIFWLYELPFILYGLLVGWVTHRVSRGNPVTRVGAVAAATGAAFHLLGPEFDFPLLAPMQFVALGTVATVVLFGLLRWQSPEETTGQARD